MNLNWQNGNTAVFFERDSLLPLDICIRLTGKYHLPGTVLYTRGEKARLHVSGSHGLVKTSDQ